MKPSTRRQTKTNRSKGMNVTVSRRELATALKRARAVMDRRSTVPVLDCVLFEVTDHNLTITATNLDERICLKVPASGRVNGSACIEFRKLNEIVRVAQSEVLRIEVAGYWEDEKSYLRFVIQSGATVYQVQGIIPDEYPRQPSEASPLEDFEVEVNELRSTFDRVSYAPSREETRPILNGVLWEVDGSGGSTLVATNGHQLALAPLRVPALLGPAETSTRQLGIIRPRALEAILGASVAGETLRVARSETWLSIESEIATLYTRIIEGPYPNYQAVLPKADGYTCTITADRRALLAAIARVAVCASDHNHRTKISVEPGGLTIEARSPDWGSASERIEVESDGSMEIGFNAEYLKKALGTLKQERVRINFTAPERAAVLVGADEEGDGSLSLIMPLRLLD